MAETRSWMMGHNDMGDYIQCPNCKRKIGFQKIRFGDIGYAECPDCHTTMDLSIFDYDRIVELTHPEQ